ncbi:MAG: hypothetical protein IT428_09785 [Planctomycetaceae bacterium]|nr:hypothetical protein [Planctomycetaceae bacterium]
MPATGVYLVFHRSGETQKSVASACTKQDGTFSAALPEAGTFVVTAFWPTVVALGEDETTEGPDRFRNRYRDPQHPAKSISVSPDEPELPPIELSL